MTTAPAPYRSSQPAGRDGFAQLLRAEFTKFRTVRAWIIALCAAVVLFVLLAFFSAFESRSTSPPVPSGPNREPVTDSYMLVNQALVDDGSLTARVTSLMGAHTSQPSASGNTSSASSNGQPGAQLEPGIAPWAKAGIILEQATTQGTDYAAVMVGFPSKRGGSRYAAAWLAQDVS